MSPQIKITITLDVPEGVIPDVAYADEPQGLFVPPPPAYDPDERVPVKAVAAEAIPSCPMHGAMTFYATKKDGTPFPRYSCDKRMPDGSFCSDEDGPGDGSGVITEHLRYFPQTKKQLADRSGYSLREVELAIHDARLEGMPIVSDSFGYWLTDDPEEVAACARRLRSRYITQARAARALRLTSRRMARPVLFPDLT